ncbi:MAG: hypothetical protein ACOZJX_17945 [Pseudomonadota bacterium]
MMLRTVIAFVFLVSGCAASAAVCKNQVAAKAPLDPAGLVVLHVASCPVDEGSFDVALEVRTGSKVTQRERTTAEGLAYGLSIDQSVDIDGDGTRDVGVANGAGRAGDGMNYWLVKRNPVYLVRIGEAPRLSLSSDGKRILYALVPGSGEVQATRVEYQLVAGQLRRVRSLQFVPIDDVRTEIRELLHVDGASGKEQSGRLATSEEAQRCMDGGPCP